MSKKQKNLHRQAASLPKCMNCGAQATVTHVDMRNPHFTLRTTWCEVHSPEVWEIVARARRLAASKWTAAPYGD